MPAAVGEDAVVRCPLCGEEYALAEAMRELPPLLEIVSAGTSAEPSRALAGPAVALEPAFEPSGEPNALAFRLSDRVSPKETEVGELASGASAEFDFAAETPAPTARGGKTSARPSPRRASKSPVAEVVKVALGGVAGLVIAQLILWWLPLDLRVNQRDPVSLARNYGQHFPWLLPEQLRELVVDSAADPTDQTAVQADPQSAAPGETPAANPGSDPLTGAPQEVVEGNFDPLTSSTGAADLFGGGGEMGIGDVNPDISAPGPAGSGGETPAADEPRASPIAEQHPLANRAVTTAAQIGEAIQLMTKAKFAWDNRPEDADGATKLKLFLDYYSAASEAAWAATFANSADPQVGRQSQILRTSIAELNRQPENLRTLGKLAELWLDNQKVERTSQGVILSGTLQSANQVGEWTELELTLNENQFCTIVSRKAPDQFPIGSKVLVLGGIFDSPQDDLREYDGAASRVVLEGLVIPQP